MSRYPTMFAAPRECSGGVFISLVMIGDPDPDTGEAVIEAFITGEADALGLGVPFTDPAVGGPAIQKAHVRAPVMNVGFQDYLEMVWRVHRRYPQLPIDMLIYGNVSFAMSLEYFYSERTQAGIDLVLLLDVPTHKSAASSRVTEEVGVDAVYIVPPSAAAETLDIVAAVSCGYVCAVSRVGVTGIERAPSTVGLVESVERLRADATAPAMPGFGISTPKQIVETIVAGVDSAISGSATVKIMKHYAPEIMVVVSSNNGVGGNEERRRYASGALRNDLVVFTATMKEVIRPY